MGGLATRPGALCVIAGELVDPCLQLLGACLSVLGALFGALAGLHRVAAGGLGGVRASTLGFGHLLGVGGALLGQLRALLGVASALPRVGGLDARPVGGLMVCTSLRERLVAD